MELHLSIKVLQLEMMFHDGIIRLNLLSKISLIGQWSESLITEHEVRGSVTRIFL